MMMAFTTAMQFYIFVLQLVLMNANIALAFSTFVHHSRQERMTSRTTSEITSRQSMTPLKLAADSSPAKPIRISSKKNKNHPEFSVLPDDDDDDDVGVSINSATLETKATNDDEIRANAAFIESMGAQTTTTTTPVVASNEQSNESKRSSTSTTKRPVKTQFSALEVGSVVQIEVGDATLARKAWKKRRRSGSPLLLPCSIVHVDTVGSIRWNCLYLLQKFGTTNNGRTKLSVSEINTRYRTHLQGSLQRHAKDLFEENDTSKTFRDVIEHIFPKNIQESYNVRLQNDVLTAAISRKKAKFRAESAAMLQFFSPNDDDRTTLEHTGVVRMKNYDDDESNDTDESNTATPYYSLVPLSAALRIRADDLNSGLVQTGSSHTAVVFDFDEQADGGMPLITLSLNPAANAARDRLKFKSSQSSVLIKGEPRHLFESVSIGKSFTNARIVKLVPGGALVDCGVGRYPSSSGGGAPPVVVYGMLRFKDAVLQPSRRPPIVNENNASDDFDNNNIDDEDWDDILTVDDLLDDDIEDHDDEEEDSDDTMAESFGELDAETEAVLAKLDDNDVEFADSEDITHLFEHDDDGNLSYKDPDSGSAEVIYQVKEESNDGAKQQRKQKEDGPIVFKQSKVKPHLFMESRGYGAPGGSLAKRYRTKTLKAGDRVDVYVKSVSKQSHQLIVTMDSSIQGRTAKELKQESTINKKLSRLEKQLGGFQKLQDLLGTECDGIIKATSSTGDWFYVQPTGDGSSSTTNLRIQNLPVGVATVDDDTSTSLQQGDAVKIQLHGVDEKRGQLAIRILRKLAP